MARSKVVREALQEAKEWELELPISFVDVVFLMLIFFICATKFKALERRLDAKLPKEGRPDIPKDVQKVEEIRVKISLKDLNDKLGPVRILVNRTPCTGLNELARKLNQLRVALPGTPVVIDGRQNVPFRWILGAVDACARARITSVKFQAPLARGGGGDRWWYE